MYIQVKIMVYGNAGVKDIHPVSVTSVIWDGMKGGRNGVHRGMDQSMKL